MTGTRGAAGARSSLDVGSVRAAAIELAPAPASRARRRRRRGVNHVG